MLTALIAVIDTSRSRRVDAVDQQHRVAMRQRRHHPPDIERADDGASGAVSVTGLVGAACAGAVVETAVRLRVERGEDVVGDVEAG